MRAAWWLQRNIKVLLHFQDFQHLSFLPSEGGLPPQEIRKQQQAAASSKQAASQTED
jgi:hypothetical protein